VFYVSLLKKSFRTYRHTNTYIRKQNRLTVIHINSRLDSHVFFFLFLFVCMYVYKTVFATKAFLNFKRRALNKMRLMYIFLFFKKKKRNLYRYFSFSHTYPFQFISCVFFFVLAIISFLYFLLILYKAFFFFFLCVRTKCVC